MNRVSLTINFYLYIFIIGITLNIFNQWERIYCWILTRGLTNSDAMTLIKEAVLKDFTVGEILGRVVGSFLFFLAIIGLYYRKSWGRKLIVVFALISGAIYIMSVEKIFKYLWNLFGGKMWTGYYLFAIFMFFSLCYTISVVVFFTRKKVKRHFKAIR